MAFQSFYGIQPARLDFDQYDTTIDHDLDGLLMLPYADPIRQSKDSNSGLNSPMVSGYQKTKKVKGTLSGNTSFWPETSSSEQLSFQMPYPTVANSTVDGSCQYQSHTDTFNSIGDHKGISWGNRDKYPSLTSISSSISHSQKLEESEDGSYKPRRYFRKCKHSKEAVEEFIAQKRREKRERNRKSAAETRRRQKEDIQELNNEINQLKRQVESILQENQSLKNFQMQMFPGSFHLNTKKQNIPNENSTAIEAAKCVLDLF